MWYGMTIITTLLIALCHLSSHAPRTYVFVSATVVWHSWDCASWYISIVKPSRCTIFRVYWISLCMFRTVFSSIIRSSRLYIQHRVYVIQVRWLPASGKSTNLYDIYLMLYVHSWTPDDGRKDRPKHAEWYWINSKNCASTWFYYRNMLL